MEKDSIYLRHILNAIQAIEKFAATTTQAEFESDEMTNSAVIRQLEIIGEAIKHLSKETKTALGGVPWSDFAGMRDVHIHEYFGVDLEEVWKTIQHDLPPLKQAIQQLENGR